MPLSSEDIHALAKSRPSVGLHEEPDEVSVGLHGILASTEKLLAVSRGVEPPDERDSAEFKHIQSPDRLLRERVKLDADKVRLGVLRRAAKTRNLSGLHPFAFDPYTEGHIVGNPLSAPGEELNPMANLQESRRITQMGPGGLGSEEAITDSARNLHPSSFGFYSAIEGPECMDALSEVYTKRGWTPWPEVRDVDVFACRVNGRLEWHKASRVIRQPYKGPMICGEHATLRMCVTPNHRVIFSLGTYGLLQEDVAEAVFQKTISLPIRHEPQLGDEGLTHFKLPDIATGGNAQRTFEPFEIGDWCEFMGWWLAEGNSHHSVVEKGKSVWHRGHVSITQCPIAHPENNRRIQELLEKMGLRGAGCKIGTKLGSGAKQLVDYFKQWENGCYDKWIPDELFDAPLVARQRMLDALLEGDGRSNKKRWCYSSVSHRLAESVERLAIGLGFTAFIREEKDTRPHVNTTNYVVSIHRQLTRSLKERVHGHSNGKTYGNYWSVVDYDGIVYCATVPGGLLHVRGKKSTSGFWTGNSGKIGIDTRAAVGTKLGSDGKIYQRFYNPHKKRHQWLSPDTTTRAVVGIPE